jgi:ankyrin repeat protein
VHSIDPSLIDTQSSDSGQTPLFCAAYKGHLKAVQLLISCGANINKETYDKCTPLIIAAWSGHLEVVECLVQRGANVHLYDKDNCNAIQLAEQDGHYEVVAYLRKQCMNCSHFAFSTNNHSQSLH